MCIWSTEYGDQISDVLAWPTGCKWVRLCNDDAVRAYSLCYQNNESTSPLTSCWQCRLYNRNVTVQLCRRLWVRLPLWLAVCNQNLIFSLYCRFYTAQHEIRGATIIGSKLWPVIMVIETSVMSENSGKLSAKQYRHMQHICPHNCQPNSTDTCNTYVHTTVRQTVYIRASHKSTHNCQTNSKDTIITFVHAAVRQIVLTRASCMSIHYCQPNSTESCVTCTTTHAQPIITWPTTCQIFTPQEVE